MPKISLKGKNLPTSPIRKLSKYATYAKAKESVIILEEALVSYPHTLMLKENP